MQKQKHGQKISKPGTKKNIQPAKLISEDAKQKKLIWKIALGIAVLGFVIYSQSLKYEFAFDDSIAISGNKLIKDGLGSVGKLFSTSFYEGSTARDPSLYRPVTRFFYALCWTVSSGSPSAFHFMNVLIYALTGFLLFVTLAKYFHGNLMVPLAASLIFIVHPIHTEVVDNCKSLDELLCFFFFICSVYFMHAYLQNKKLLSLVLASLVFLFSFLSKESAIAFLIVTPLLLYFSGKTRSEILKTTFALLLATGMGFMMRYSALGFAANVKPTAGDNILMITNEFLLRKTTAVYLSGMYLLKLIVPHPLVCDYSLKQFTLVSAGDWRFWISLTAYAGLLGYAFMQFKKKNLISFGILFFLVTSALASNIFVIIGTHFAERLMYAPSLGICIMAAGLLTRGMKTTSPSGSFKQIIFSDPLPFFILVAVAAVFTFKTIAQNPVWKNNISLFRNAVDSSPDSFRARYNYARYISDESNLKGLDKPAQDKVYAEAISQLQTSISIYVYAPACDNLATIYFIQNKLDSAKYYYALGLTKDPYSYDLNYYMGKLLNREGNFKEAIPYLNLAIAQKPTDFAYFNLAIAYINQGDNDAGLKYLLKAIEVNPQWADVYNYIGQIYQAKGDSALAKKYAQQAAALGYGKTGN